jgi:hypothetical protein
MAKSSAVTISVTPKKRCCRSSKRCKRCPVVVRKARAHLVREGISVGSNPRMIELISAPDDCKKLRKRLEKAISASR